MLLSSSAISASEKNDCFVEPATVSDSITLHYKSNISDIIGELIT